MAGKLEKMLITAFKPARSQKEQPVLSKTPEDSYMVMVNPETYKINYQVNYAPTVVPGTPGRDAQYVNTEPPTLQFDFLFDGTGVIPKPAEGLAGALENVPVLGAIASALSGGDAYNVLEEIRKFNHVIYEYKGEQHSPRKVQLTWGELSFDGVLSSLSYDFKLFKPDGTPLRAIASATFTGTISDFLREAKYKPSSPDLTHVKVVGEGDTLPLMAYQIYGDASYYLEVVRVNNLTNFRKLVPGTKLFFPPIDKSTA